MQGMACQGKERKGMEIHDNTLQSIEIQDKAWNIKARHGMSR
jgi:hypothetical protein